MNLNKSLSLMQIGMMILGVVSFAYLVGDGLPTVSAAEWLSDEYLLQIRGNSNEVLAEIDYLDRSDPLYSQKLRILNYVGNIPSLDFKTGVETLSEAYPEELSELKVFSQNSFGSCLTSSSQITLADLQTKSISEIQIGDEVLSYDFENNKLTKEIVRGVIISQKSEYLVLNNVLEITPNHEILLNGEWQEVGNARVGDLLRGIEGNEIIIERIERVVLDSSIDVYDLDLGGKWYFAEGVLVHNSGTGASPKKPASVVATLPAPSRGSLWDRIWKTPLGRLENTSFTRGSDGNYRLNLEGIQGDDYTSVAGKLGVNLGDGQTLKMDGGQLKIYNGEEVVKNVELPKGVSIEGNNLIAEANSGYIKEILEVPQKADFKDGKYILYDKETPGKILAEWDAKTGIQTKGQVNTAFGPLGTAGGVTYLLEGLQWAGIAYGAIGLIGGLFMEDKPEQLKAVQKAVFSGIMAASATRMLIAKGGVTSNLGKGWLGDKTTLWLQQNQGIVSFGVGALVAWAMYNHEYRKETTRVEEVTFQCMPWQAPRGGNDCDLCNDGPLPCSEYRCKSLGQSCEIVNKGTADEKCMNMFVNNVAAPKISPWEEVLTDGFRYDGVGIRGVSIKNSGTSYCIPPFTPLEFGILTDIPAQCKIDIENKPYDEMNTYFGGDSLYTKNHSEYLSLPNFKDIKNSSIKLGVDEEMNLFVRCLGANNVTNEAPYVINFCVDPSPDTTAPIIQATSIETNSCVAANRNSTEVSFYTNEPAQCKWGFEERAYDSLPYNMSCSTQPFQMNSMLLYTCTTDLTSVSRAGTNYYVRCEDNQNAPKNERNQMQQSEVFNLRGSNPLKLTTILPNKTVYGGTSPMRVELKAETLQGCDNNKAVCFYSPTGNENSYIMFYDTDQTGGIHTQMLDLYEGEHTYFVKCVDAGGNVAEGNTTFTLDIDTDSPIVTRAYFDDSDYLTIVTARDSTCSYTTESCNFVFEEGQTTSYPNSPYHKLSTEDDKSYFIKCTDEFRAEPVNCSIIVKPKSNFLIL